MKLVATALITLFATVALAEGTGTATTTTEKTTKTEKTATATAPTHEMGKEAAMDKMCEGKKGKELTKCQEDMKKAHTTH